jgi:hypothetical protein
MLHKKLGPIKFCFDKVPHSLGANHMAEQVTLFHQFLRLLQPDEENSRTLLPGMSVGSFWKRRRFLVGRIQREFAFTIQTNYSDGKMSPCDHLISLEFL